MKKILLLCFCFVSVFVNAQGKDPLVSISSPNWQTLYIGIDNFLYISVAGYSSESVTVSMTGGKIKRDYNTVNEYVVNPDAGAETADIVISLKTKSGVRKISTDKYRVAQLPSPIIKIGAFDGGKINANQFASVESIYAESPVFTQNVHYTVTEYNYMIVQQNGAIKSFTDRVVGNSVTPDLKQRLLTMRPGDKFIIYDASINLDGKFIQNKQATVFTIR